MVRRENDVNALVINPEFRNQIPRLTEEEREQLEANIREHGCRDPLTVWRGVLLDGHNRFEICNRLGIAFAVSEIDLPDEDAAANWIDANQLGRRNLSPDARKLLLGRLYNRVKKAQGAPEGNANRSKQSGQNAHFKTAEKLAADHGVNESTVRRAGKFAEAVAEVIEIEPELLARGESELFKAAKRRAHVSNNSGENEWYTPKHIIEAARRVMGGIDLDPASSEIANRTVQAARFFTAEDDGLQQEWPVGRIWLNPPYSQPLIAKFSDKFTLHMMRKPTSQGIALVNNATETAWGQKLLSVATAVCFPQRRTRFLDPLGNPGSPLQGQMIVYAGAHSDCFAIGFSEFGEVLRRG